MARFGKETKADIPKTPEAPTPAPAPAKPVKSKHPKVNAGGHAFGGECIKCRKPIYGGEGAVTFPQGMICKSCKPQK